MSAVTAPARVSDIPAFNRLADFYQVRDFGQKWEATAQLLRWYGRPLLLTLARYALPWLLAGGLLQVLVMGYKLYFDYGIAVTYLGSALMRVGEIVGTGIIYGFLRLRMSLHESPGYRLTPDDIWAATQGIGLYFGKYLTVMLLCVAGFFLMIAPSVYVYVAFALVPGVVFMEHDGLTRTFELIKGNWWPTAALVGTVLGLNLSLNLLPSLLITSFFRILMFTDSVWVWVVVAGQQLLTVAALLVLLLVRETLMAFHYFSVIEEREHLGLEARLNQLGQQPAPARPAADDLYAPHDYASY